MKKIFFFLTTTFLLSGCIDFQAPDIEPLVGQAHFYTTNDTSQYYLFSQGIDFGKIAILDDFNQNTSLISLLLVGLPSTFSENNEHEYSFFVKKVDVDDPIAEGNIIIKSGNISVEMITGTFEIDTTFIDEADLPNAVIKINE